MVTRYALDANVVAEFGKLNPAAGVQLRLAELSDNAFLPAPVWHELLFGVERMPQGRKRRERGAMLDSAGARFPILPYTEEAAAWHARERARLESVGEPRPFIDGQIAAIAAVNGLTLATRNIKHFRDYRGLSVENWWDD